MTGTIYTIGHSTHSIEKFIAMLESFEIEVLVDIRSFPGSRRYPWFNREQLLESIGQMGMKYYHFPELGGRRKPVEHSQHPEWEHPSFRSYADYMDSAEFKKGIDNLLEIAIQYRTAYMCSEAVWWRCHRSLVSDYLKTSGWQVIHIMDESKSQEHPFTTVARKKQENLFFNGDG